MRRQIQTSLRVAALLTTAAAAFASLIGIPANKASAETAPTKPGQPGGAPATAAPRGKFGITFGLPLPRQEVIQPRFVSPSAATLMRIADQALSNNALAEQIFRDPAAVAAQYHLSSNELLVLRHMDREQFEVARADAARLVQSRLASGRPMPPGATDARRITEGMVVGRSILAAVGRSYREAASANACCPWSKAVEVGVGRDPAAYNGAFARPAGGQ